MQTELAMAMSLDDLGKGSEREREARLKPWESLLF